MSICTSWVMRTRPESGANREIAMKSTSTGTSGIAREIGEEQQRALEHADEHDAVGMIGAISSPMRTQQRAQLLRSEQDWSLGHGSFRNRTTGARSAAGARCAGGGRDRRARRASRSRAALGIALAPVRHEHLLEERRLALDERAVHAQVPRFDAELHERLRDPRDRERVLVEERPIGSGDRRLQEPVRLELGEPGVVETGEVGELGTGEDRAPVLEVERLAAVVGERVGDGVGLAPFP